MARDVVQALEGGLGGSCERGFRGPPTIGIGGWLRWLPPFPISVAPAISPVVFYEDVKGGSALT